MNFSFQWCCLLLAICRYFNNSWLLENFSLLQKHQFNFLQLNGILPVNCIESIETKWTRCVLMEHFSHVADIFVNRSKTHFSRSRLEFATYLVCFCMLHRAFSFIFDIEKYGSTSWTKASQETIGCTETSSILNL